MSVSIILPTYNEKENIKRLIPELEALIKKQKLDAEIIIVDDSSPDGTWKLAEQLNKKYGNIIVIKKKDKEGIGAALRVGYTSAKKDIILSMDSDLSFDTNDIPRFIKKINEGYDLVLGSRHLNKDDYERQNLTTMTKGFVSKYGNLIINLMAGIKIHDFSANFRAIKREVWNNINTKENTNSLLLEMIIKTHYKGYKITEIPVVFMDRVYGESKLNLKKEAPKFFAKALYFIFKERFYK